MGMKTGCSTEQRQLETVHALRNFLAFATVVAWQMLCLRDAARRPESVRADKVLTPLQMTVLCGLRHGSNLTVSPAKRSERSP